MSRHLVAGLAVALLAPPAAAYTPEEIDAAAPVARQVEPIVRQLAADDLAGRSPGSPGSMAARELLIDELEPIADGLDAMASGRDAYRQPFDDIYENILAVIPGSELSGEFVVVGAHFDHLAPGTCRFVTAGDSICNGANDNAAGVGVVLAIGRALRALPRAPRRSVVLALWDGEEEGLLGSAHFVANPPLSLGDVAAYVNFDSQGSNLVPSARRSSFAIGAETGGALLQQLTEAAIAPAGLDTHLLTVLFGQGRSDYHPFWLADVPVVFFSDATNACYHSTKDDLAVVDWSKLARQGEIGFRLVASLAEADEPPTFTPPAALASFDDLLVISEFLTRSLVDLPLFESWAQGQLVALEADARAQVEAGPDAFTPVPLLNVATEVLNIAVTGIACDPALLPEPGAGPSGALVLASLLALRRRQRRSAKRR